MWRECGSPPSGSSVSRIPALTAAVTPNCVLWFFKSIRLQGFQLEFSPTSSKNPSTEEVHPILFLLIENCCFRFISAASHSHLQWTSWTPWEGVGLMAASASLPEVQSWQVSPSTLWEPAPPWVACASAGTCETRPRRECRHASCEASRLGAGWGHFTVCPALVTCPCDGCCAACRVASSHM